LPGIEFNDLNFASEVIPFQRTVESFRDCSLLSTLYVFPGQIVVSLCSVSSVLRAILKGRGRYDYDTFQEMARSLHQFVQITNNEELRNLLQRQSWRFQDLRDGGGLGFLIETFFVSIKYLLTNSSLTHGCTSVRFVP
jgi:hypothetical protein